MPLIVSNTMKKIKILVAFIALTSCSPKLYTDNYFFDCGKNQRQNLESDRKTLITLILKRSVVVNKDVADYELIKDKKRIYVLNKWYSSFFGKTAEDQTKEYPLTLEEIPVMISDVEFCIKSKQELQAIADKTAAFVYLIIGDIEITGDIAKIGVATFWQGRSDSRTVYLSGGGYVLQYKKVNGEWIFDKGLQSWQS